MKTLVKENTFLKRGFGMDFGWGNGYAFIPEGHKFHRLDYDEINNYINIHGGLTYSSLVNKDLIKYWNLDEDLLGTWCVGFDTAHYNDSIIRWPKEKVQRETERLRDQLIKYNKNI